MLLATFLFSLSPTLQSADSQRHQPPILDEPPDGAAAAVGIPHFRWRASAPPSIGEMGGFLIQIATDGEFARVVDEDRIAAVITRYVPDKELVPGKYWWRVAAVDALGVRGSWSEARGFSIGAPKRVVNISKDAKFADIQRALTEVSAQSPATLRFEPGDYRLDPVGATEFIGLTNASDVVVDGNGADLTFTGFLKFVRLEHCRRILIKNLTFDFDPLPYTAGRVLSADVGAGTFEVEIAPAHPLPESNPAFARDKKGMIVDPRFPRVKRGVELVIEHAGWQKLGERRYRFAVANKKQIRQMGAGDVYVLDPRIATGFDVNGCDDVVFLNLTAYAVANEAFNSHYGNRHSILHCGIRLKPGRFIAANNGGHNHHNARLGPWIEGCTWENTGDDICHVNCLVVGIDERLASARLRLPLRNPYDSVGPSVALDVLPGDMLQFFNRGTGRLLSERRVARVTKLEKWLDVAFDGDVGEIVTGRPGIRNAGLQKVPANQAATQVFNLSRTCNQFVFRNNAVRNGRRVGVLAKGCGGLIEGNTFDGLGGGAVECWNAPFEGLGAVDYVVRGNRIRDCGQLAREHAAIWATIFKSGADKLHRNLIIADNEIANFHGTPILLRDVQDGRVQGNRLLLSPDEARGESIKTINVSDVLIERNTITEYRP